MIEDTEQVDILRKFYDVDVDAPYYPTGVTLLDEVVGGGLGYGYAGGKVVNIASPPSMGKTFLAWHTIVANIHFWEQHNTPFKWMYDDAEHGSTMDLNAIYGVDVAPENLCSSETIEEFHASANKFIRELQPGERGIYVLDSLDPLKTDADIQNVEKDLSKIEDGEKNDRGSYNMAKQKYMSNNFFPQIIGVLHEKQALIILISQVRYNIDPRGMGPKYTISGGMAIEHLYNTRIMLQKQVSYDITRDKETINIGVGVKAVVQKNKCPRPGRSCVFDIYFSRGIDDVGACVDYLYQLRTPTGQPVKTVSVKWDDQVFKNRDQFIKYVYENNLYRELRKRTIEKWEQIEQAGVDEARNRIPTQQWGW
jgi:RecA/RadA recombinase